MRRVAPYPWAAAVLAIVVSQAIAPAWGQAFSSGSTGSLGALAPASNTTVVLPSDGILNYTTVTIPAGVTVTFQRNAANTPVTVLAQGDVTIAGTIRLNGEDAIAGPTSGAWGVTAGRKGGPGGYDGGDGGLRAASASNGTGGQGPGGGSPGLRPAIFAHDGSYGAASSFVALIPLYGGSGGGGGVGTTSQNGAAGAGGGGAIVIASTTQITIPSTGSITANGGAAYLACTWEGGGAGSGGAVRLVAPQVTNQGTVQAKGGNPSCVGNGAVGYPGRVRVECTTCSVATSDPAASTSSTLGPVSAASTPPLVSLPTLMISTVGGTTVPATLTGAHASPDMVLPYTSPSEIPVTLTATNVPVPSQFVVKLIPAMGEPMFFPTTFSTGSLASSTATATVRVPSNVVCVLTAFVNFTQVAGLFPMIDGEEVEQVLIATRPEEPSMTSLITKSGLMIPVSSLPQEDQVRVASVLSMMQSVQ